MFSSSHLAEKQVERDQIAAAMEEFYARGNTKQVLQQGQVADIDAKRRTRQFVIDPVKHEKQTAKPRPAKAKPENNPNATPRRLATIAVAKAKQCRMAAAARQELALKVAVHAGLGDSERKTASDLGVSRNYLRRVAKEFNIQFHPQA